VFSFTKSRLSLSFSIRKKNQNTTELKSIPTIQSSKKLESINKDKIKPCTGKNTNQPRGKEIYK
jgi:hypothetical protein